MSCRPLRAPEVQVLAVLALLTCATRRRDECRVEHRRRIAAPAGPPWPLVGEPRGLDRWSPGS
jgi:hypothetical protein